MDQKINTDTTFTYTYSASENKEVLAIRDKYLPRSENKLEELKRLDGYVQGAGITEPLSLGIGGTLLLGIALCGALGVLALNTVLTVLPGAVGICMIIAAYPLHRRLKSRAKEKYAARIIELADEISGKKI